jgi:mannose-6-phosphate isomerase-like protein (cupin superfamily)
MKNFLDPMDRFSLADNITSTPGGLGYFLSFPVRALADKPGRSLFVLSDKRHLEHPCFDVAYSYVNILWNKGNQAGNHFHELKEEIFTILEGSFQISLKSLDGTKFETLVLSAPKEGETSVTRLYIPIHTAHKIESLTSPAIIHVAATSPNTNADEYPFVL